jgi:hypothetical protein
MVARSTLARMSPQLAIRSVARADVPTMEAPLGVIVVQWHQIPESLLRYLNHDSNGRTADDDSGCYPVLLCL